MATPSGQLPWKLLQKAWLSTAVWNSEDKPYFSTTGINGAVHLKWNFGVFVFFFFFKCKFSSKAPFSNTFHGWVTLRSASYLSKLQPVGLNERRAVCCQVLRCGEESEQRVGLALAWSAPRWGCTQPSCTGTPHVVWARWISWGQKLRFKVEVFKLLKPIKIQVIPSAILI